MDEILDEDFNSIQVLLRVTTDVSNLYMAIEKYFGPQGNYAKVGFCLYCM